MNATTVREARAQPGWVQVVVALGGVSYALSGLALLFAPQWFYDNIGTFPPFNRHYAGDLGTFLLPLGVGLLFAARQPARHAGLIGVAALASLLHTLNHAYDDLLANPLPIAEALADLAAVLIPAVLLSLAYRSITMIERRERR